MKKYQHITLREKPELMNMAAEWFHSKWGVPNKRQKGLTKLVKPFCG